MVALSTMSAEQTSWRTGTTTVASRARTLAESHPAKVAMRQKQFGIWRQTMWQEAWELVDAAANGLLALGLQPGDRVSIHAEDRREWVIMDLATVAIRATTVGLYPTNPAADVQYTIDDCAPVVHLAEDQEQVDKIVEQPEGSLASLKRVIYLEQRGFANYTDPRLMSWEQFLELGRGYRTDNPGALDARMAAAQPDDVMTLVYTSGTTGPPKGAMLTNANGEFCIETLVMNPARMPGGKLPNGKDEIVSFLPLCEVAERAFSTWHLVSAATVLNFAENANEVTTALREVQPTLFFATPGIWERLLGGVTLRAADASRFKKFTLNRALDVSRWIGRKRVANHGKWSVATRIAYAIGWLLVFRSLREKLGLRYCRAAVSGTAPVAPEVLEFFMGIGLDIYEIYGLTESTALATANLVGNMELGTVGEPYPEIADGIRIDEQSNEIQIRHAGVFAGYWNQPELTAQTFTADGWLKTGDCGRWEDAKHIRFVERMEHFIAIGGKHVSPSEIENSLKTSPFISEAMVVGDRREYLTSLIAIEMETVGAWARKQGISFTTFRDLTDKEEVVQLIQDAVERTNAKIGEVKTVKDFRLIPKELDHEDGELTATHKLKRATVEHMYGSLVESMY